MKISLSDHFTYNKLIRFTMPSILMMMLTSTYSIVDGLFISNCIGKTSLAAINLVVPFWSLTICFSFIFAAGGSAYISKALGEGNKEKANKSFSLFIYTSIILGILFAILGYALSPRIIRIFGVESGELFSQSLTYIRTVFLVNPFIILQIEFEQFSSTAEKPKLGFYVTLASGFMNIVLDAIVVMHFNLGILGAAIATDISALVGGGVPLLYFASKNSSLLRLGKCSLDFRALLKAVTNGISELVSNLSGPLINFLYNYQLMRYIGESGVAAFGVVTYVFFLFQSIFLGYAFGVAPIFGFNFGSKNKNELSNLFIKSIKLIFIFSLIMFFIGEVFSGIIANLFVSYDESLFNLTKFALKVYTFAYLFLGFNIFGSVFFTSISDGITSAKIAMLRSCCITPIIVLLFPYFFGKNSIWWTCALSQLACIFITIYFFNKKKKSIFATSF